MASTEQIRSAGEQIEGKQLNRRERFAVYRGWVGERLVDNYLAAVVLMGIAVVGVFENDNPPNRLFSGAANPTLWRAIAFTVAVAFGWYWFSFLKVTGPRAYHDLVDRTSEGAANGRLVAVLAFLTVAAWLVTYVGLSWADYRTLPASSSDRCGTAVADAAPLARPGQDAPSLAADGPVAIAFGTWRDERRGQTSLLVPAEVETPDIDAGDFVVTALGNGNEVLPADRVRVGVQRLADRVLLDVCVDLRGLPRSPAGRYDAQVVYTGAAANVAPIPIEVTLQARYLWALIPGVWVLAALAMWLVFDRWPEGLRSQLTSFIGVAAPIAVVLGAQGMRNPAWGGGLLGIVGLLATMYGAGVGASELLKQGGHERSPTTATGELVVSAGSSTGTLTADVTGQRGTRAEVTVPIEDGIGSAPLPSSLPADAYELTVRRAAQPERAATSAQVSIETTVTAAEREVSRGAGSGFTVVGGEHVVVTLTVADPDAVLAP